MSFGLRITGDKAIISSYKDFEGRIRNKSEFLVMKHGILFLNKARLLCPVRDGRLRNSISWELSSDRLSITVGPNVFYAVYVEYGTGVYATGEGGSRARKIPWVYRDPKTGKFYTTVGNPPQPFMGPAWRESQPLFVRDLEAMVARELAA